MKIQRFLAYFISWFSLVFCGVAQEGTATMAHPDRTLVQHLKRVNLFLTTPLSQTEARALVNDLSPEWRAVYESKAREIHQNLRAASVVFREWFGFNTRMSHEAEVARGLSDEQAWHNLWMMKMNHNRIWAGLHNRPLPKENFAVHENGLIDARAYSHYLSQDLSPEVRAATSVPWRQDLFLEVRDWNLRHVFEKVIEISSHSERRVTDVHHDVVNWLRTAVEDNSLTPIEAWWAELIAMGNYRNAYQTLHDRDIRIPTFRSELYRAFYDSFQEANPNIPLQIFPQVARGIMNFARDYSEDLHNAVHEPQFYEYADALSLIDSNNGRVPDVPNLNDIIEDTIEHFWHELGRATVTAATARGEPIQQHGPTMEDVYDAYPEDDHI